MSRGEIERIYSEFRRAGSRCEEDEGEGAE